MVSIKQLSSSASCKFCHLCLLITHMNIPPWIVDILYSICELIIGHHIAWVIFIRTQTVLHAWHTAQEVLTARIMAKGIISFLFHFLQQRVQRFFLSKWVLFFSTSSKSFKDPIQTKYQLCQFPLSLCSYSYPTGQIHRQQHMTFSALSTYHIWK